jgi:tripartite-type tricarboxylate transporter receptor subunit TctC
MGSIKKGSARFSVGGVLLAILIALPSLASGQTYPDKPITIYCGYAAGATTDATTRALAKGAEKILGVPVVVENKPGGASSVCAALVASKKPDGYALGVVDTSARPPTSRWKTSPSFSSMPGTLAGFVCFPNPP